VEALGLKDWLAKNVAGASSYREVMGRECAKNGVVIGRMVFLSHGRRATPSDRCVFKDGEEMEAGGFTPYCGDPLNRPPLQDSSELSKETRAAGVAFAVQLALAASSNFMRTDANRSDFQRLLAVGTKTELAALQPEITMERGMRFLQLPTETPIQVLDIEYPGTTDVLGAYLRELCKQNSSGSVAFQQKGILGFDVAAVPLAQETALKIREACQKFKW
jgi:hypothetical protein